MLQESVLRYTQANNVTKNIALVKNLPYIRHAFESLIIHLIYHIFKITSATKKLSRDQLPPVLISNSTHQALND